jgi:hypothetical protein
MSRWGQAWGSEVSTHVEIYVECLVGWSLLRSISHGFTLEMAYWRLRCF